MRDPYEVLREKEAAMKRVRIEVMSLKLVASLLADDPQPQPVAEPLLDHSDPSVVMP